MKTTIETSLLIALLLCLVFVIRTMWPAFFIWEALVFVIDLSIILSGLVLSFNKNKSKLNYKTSVRNGILTGLISGILTALFVYLYTNVIDPYYYEKLAQTQLAVYKQEENFDEYIGIQTLKAIGFMRRYNILALRYIFTNTLCALAVSLMISPFFVRSKQFA